MFELHPQLNADTINIGDFELSRLLMMNNRALPWFILVPRRHSMSEWHQLNKQDQLQLHNESMQLSTSLMQRFNGDKLNIGALGNLVPQLHVHHIVRYKTDDAWPAPVWGNLSNRPYTEEQALLRKAQMQEILLSAELSFSVSVDSSE